MTRLGVTKTDLLAPPRAMGAVELSVKPGPRGTCLSTFRHSGSLRAVFPRTFGGSFEAVTVNTAGGVTGGDAFALSASAAPGTRLTITTQAAERAYRAAPGTTGTIRNRLFLAEDARVNWLPQETILFDGSALDRTLAIEAAPGASVLLAEALVLGRVAMGEHVRDARLSDRIEIRRTGRPLFLDRIAVAGDAEAHFARAWTCGGAGALATVVFLDPAAEGLLPAVRDRLPDTAGASLLAEGLLVARILAPDSHALRQSLVPVLTLLAGEDLPRPWML